MSLAELQKDIRITIPVVAEFLKDSHSDVRKAAINFLSRLAVQCRFLYHFLVCVLNHVCS